LLKGVHALVVWWMFVQWLEQRPPLVNEASGYKPPIDYTRQEKDQIAKAVLAGGHPAADLCWAATMMRP